MRHMLAFVMTVLSCQLLAGIGVTDEGDFPREQLEFFEKQIRPVLAAQCWGCHAEAKHESGLRLDSRAAVLAGGDRGPAVKAGEGSASLMVHAIRRDDELKMPPNGRLSAEQASAVSRWIDLGLPWPKETGVSAREMAWQSHWAFQPVSVPDVPFVEGDVWSGSPVDRFVLAKLRSLSANPSSVADRRTLIRRASFDLRGLPPTAEEVDEFQGDNAADAFERLTDRLLASPRYGERWGRHWLDVARYADNKGYVFFEEQSYPWAYTYRDYVIQSLNEDKPYDQFVVEQLAADQLDRHGDDRSLAAMGYLTVGSHFMGNVHDIIDDRIDVVTRGLMGLTVTCARCHDHKYDPIPTADYYSLYGVFRSTVEPLVPPLFSPPPETAGYARFTAELSLRQQKLDDFVQQKHAALVEGARTRVGEYLLAARAAAERPAMDDFMLIADPGDLNPAMVVRWQAYLAKLDGQSAVGAAGEPSQAVWGPWLSLSAVPEDRFAEEAARSVSQIKATGPGALNSLVADAICGRQPPDSLKELSQRYGELMKSIHVEWQAQLRDAVILKRPAPTRLVDDAREAVRLELYREQAPANVPLVFGWGFLSLLPDRASQGEYQKVLKEVEQWIINGPGAPPRAMVVLEGELHEPRIFQRGNPSRPGAVVPRRFLSALRGRSPFLHGSGRLELAQAIVDPSNPLTSRVFVNRLWHEHFGAGLVRTPSDFGLRSDPPTHPELLDWLAREFVEGGTGGADRSAGSTAEGNRFSIKRMQRLLMTCQTWRQASGEMAGMSIDPDNQFWNRMNRRRLDFEATRDALVFVTGSLQDRIGGPSQNLLEGFQPRRTLYTFLNRQDLPGLLSVFDFPSPAATSGQRETTTISPQALFLMNAPLMSAVADGVGSRSDLALVSNSADRIRAVYAILFQRRPTSGEEGLAEEYLGEQPSPTVWSRFIHALLVTNEFVFVD
jgi:hypothetical protein